MKRKTTALILAFVLGAVLFSGCAESNKSDVEDSASVSTESSESVPESAIESETSAETETMPEATESTPETEPETAPETATETEGTSETDTETETTPETETVSEAETEEEQPSYTVSDMNAVMYAKSSVNVRNIPSSDGNKLGKLSYAEEVQVTGRADNGWYRIEYNGGVGFVSGSYLVTEKPQEKNSDSTGSGSSSTSTGGSTGSSAGGSSSSGNTGNSSTGGNSGSGSSTAEGSGTASTGSGSGSVTCSHTNTSDYWSADYDKQTVGGCWWTYRDWKKVCNDCGAIVDQKLHIPSTASHNTHEIQAGKPATCTESGYGNIVSCDCGENYADYSNETFPATGHYATYPHRYTGEVNEEGTLAHWVTKCSDCGLILEEGWD